MPAPPGTADRVTQHVGLRLLALRSPAADEVSVHCVGYLPFAVMNYYQLNDFSQQDSPEQLQAGRGSEQCDCTAGVAEDTFRGILYRSVLTSCGGHSAASLLVFIINALVMMVWSLWTR